MKAPRRAVARIRDARSIPLLALLLLALSAPLSAAEREQPRGGSGGDRHAVPSQGSGGGGGRSDGGSSPRFDPPTRTPPSYSPPPSSSSGGGGSDRGPRVAVPGPGHDGDIQPRRQRPHDNDNRGGGRWHGGGGGYYGGGWYGYYPRYYYYGPYWGWGLGWWWDDHYWYGAYPGAYHPYRYGRYDARYGRYGDRYETVGALDLDVAPGRTQVWLDGRYTGTVDDYDGFPQYLWLDEGVYDLVLYLDGYKTVARQITVRPGSVMSIDDRLERGESVRPEDLATKTHERRDERIRSEEERREEIARRRDRDDMADWRERARRRMEERDRYEREREEAEEAEEDDDEDEESDDIGRLSLDILPSDASVYVDGRFIGTGADVQRLRQGLRLEPGEHRIAVVRPGHKAEEREFTVGPGQNVEIEIELESME